MMPSPNPLSAARRDSRTALDEHEAKALLASFGIRVPAAIAIDAGGDFRRAVAGLSPPFAVKVLSGSGMHKSDVGGVRLGIADAEGVGAAIDAIRADVLAHGIDAARFLVEEMAPSGVEMVVGGLIDARFGPVLMAGLGGTFVELFADVAFRVCPIDAFDATDMLDELGGIRLLRGYRGAPVCDEAALADALLRIGGSDGLLVRHRREIRELDINPMIVSPAGAVAVDARLLLAPPEAAA